MAIQAYELTLADDDHHGVVLVDTVSEVPLPVTRNAFGDVEEAHDFVAWCNSQPFGDPRRLNAEALWNAVEKWRKEV